MAFSQLCTSLMQSTFKTRTKVRPIGIPAPEEWALLLRAYNEKRDYAVSLAPGCRVELIIHRQPDGQIIPILGLGDGTYRNINSPDIIEKTMRMWETMVESDPELAFITSRRTRDFPATVIRRDNSCFVYDDPYTKHCLRDASVVKQLTQLWSPETHGIYPHLKRRKCIVILALNGRNNMMGRLPREIIFLMFEYLFVLDETRRMKILW